ncbi:hypothetical protein [Herbaspirillum seropedicae]|uniref:hypothetical protein n=1 Tax=Herbaspirillum seropedicae TaxID=964 RepID=UPI003399AD8E
MQMQTKLKHIALAALLALNGCASQSDNKTAAATAAPTPAPAPVKTSAVNSPTQAAGAAAPADAPVAAVSTATVAAPVPVASAKPDPAMAAEPRLGVLYTTSFIDGSRLKEVPEEVLIVRPKNTQNTVAAQVALNIFMFALGGGMAVNTFSKDDLKGDKIEDVKDRNRVRNQVASGFTAQLSRALNTALQSQPEMKTATFKQRVMVAGGSAKLVYEALTGEQADLYKMSTNLSVYKRKESAGMLTFSPFVEVSCNRTSEQALPLDEWAKDDYAQVEQWMAETFEQCSNKVVGALPDLLAS